MTQRRALFVAVALLVVSAGALVAWYRGRNLTTDTQSSDLKSDQAKIAFLGKYLKLRSEVEATEFHVVYHDNSGGLVTVPGPSDYDVAAVLRVPRAGVAAWTEGAQRTDGVDLGWGYALLPKTEAWSTHGAPTTYVRGGTVIAVFEPERIVFERVTSSRF
jgi:hypothetical protein